jgi:K(+)-stimulated pyrophosphate-energized sodium pump
MDALVFLLFITVSGALGLGTAFSLHSTLQGLPTGTDQMQKISHTIRTATFSFVRKEWGVILLCTILSGVLLSFLLETQTAPLTISLFVLGVLTAFTVSALGLRSALSANTRVCEAARHSPRAASRTAFLSGATLGLSVLGIALLVLGTGLLGLGVIAEKNLLQSPEILLGLFLGASSVALFMRTGGGIAAKAADIAADLHDDSRNPAVIVDHVGDNIGHVAGVGTDLYAHTVGAAVATMFIGAQTIGTQSALLFPLIIVTTGLLAGIISTILIGMRRKSPASGKTLKRGNFFVALLVLAATFFFSRQFFPMHMVRGISLCIALGLIVGIIISAIAEYYASPLLRPGKQLAEAAKGGGTTTILLGAALGASSTGPFLLCIALAVCIAYSAAGLYGISLVTVGMLSMLTLPLAGGASTPVFDNAFGIATLANLPQPVRNTTKDLHTKASISGARSRGFALAAGFLTALTLFTAFGEKAQLSMTNLLHPLVLIGLFLGALLPFLFSSMVIMAVGRTAHALIEEVHRMLKRKGAANPTRSLTIATTVGLQEMVTPTLLAIVAPLSVGFLLGHEVLTGLLAGSLIVSLLLAITFLHSGSAWHAAKMLMESGKFGGKTGDAYKGILIGDAIGDPLKDVIGPSLFIFVHLMLTMALLTATLFPASGLL